MTHKMSTVVFAQGWLDGQMESMVSNAASKGDEDPTTLLIVTQIQEQWAIVSNALDTLIKENAELTRKLAVVESAFR